VFHFFYKFGREEKDRSALNSMFLGLWMIDPMHLLAGISWEVVSVRLLPPTIYAFKCSPLSPPCSPQQNKTSCPNIYLSFSCIPLLHFPAFHHHLPCPSRVSSSPLAYYMLRLRLLSQSHLSLSLYIYEPISR
jgi:hypothetical protein